MLHCVQVLKRVCALHVLHSVKYIQRAQQIQDLHRLHSSAHARYESGVHSGTLQGWGALSTWASSLLSIPSDGCSVRPATDQQRTNGAMNPEACSLSSPPPSQQPARPGAACQSAHTPCIRQVQEQGMRHVECVAAAARQIQGNRRGAPQQQLHSAHCWPDNNARCSGSRACSRICRLASLLPCHSRSSVRQHHLHCLTGWPASALPHSQCWSCCTSGWDSGGRNLRGCSGECTLWHVHHCAGLSQTQEVASAAAHAASEEQHPRHHSSRRGTAPRLVRGKLRHARAPPQPCYPPAQQTRPTGSWGAPADVREDAYVWVLP